MTSICFGQCFPPATNWLLTQFANQSVSANQGGWVLWAFSYVSLLNSHQISAVGADHFPPFWQPPPPSGGKGPSRSPRGPSPSPLRAVAAGCGRTLDRTGAPAAAEAVGAGHPPSNSIQEVRGGGAGYGASRLAKHRGTPSPSCVNLCNANDPEVTQLNQPSRSGGCIASRTPTAGRHSLVPNYGICPILLPESQQ